MIERYIVSIIKTFYEPYFQNNMRLLWNVIIPARLSICPCRKFDARMTLCWAIRLVRFIYLSTFISLCGVTAVGHLWCCSCSRFGKIYWSEIWMFLVTNQQVDNISFHFFHYIFKSYVLHQNHPRTNWIRNWNQQT